MASHNQPPQEAVAPLPVIGTVLAAFASVALQLGLLARAGKIAVLMLIAASFLSLALPGGGNAAFFLFLVSLAAASHFGVSWCRVMLLGPGGLPSRALAWRAPHWSFLAFILLCGALTLLVLFPTSIIGSILGGILGLTQGGSLLPIVSLSMALMLLGMSYVLARVGFVFPAAAVEESYSLAHALQHSRGRGGFRIAAALALVILPLALIHLLTFDMMLRSLSGHSLADLLPQLPADGSMPGAMVLTEPTPRDPPGLITVIFWNLTTMAVNFLSMAVVFSALCLAFRTCTGWVPATGNLPAAPEDDESRRD
jgi:hypothetical protein